MAAAAILTFGKMSITLDWIKISAPYFMEYASKPFRDDHVIKCRNRTLVRVTSSNKRLKHKCVNLSDYNRYLNQMRYTTQIPYYQHAGMAKFTAAILNFGKMSNSGLYKNMHQILCEDAPWSCGDDHVTKCRNRKLIRVTSSINV